MAFGNYNESLPFWHPGRLYERARQEQNDVQILDIAIDRKVSDLQRRSRQIYPIPDLTTDLADTRFRMQRVLKENQYAGTATWTDYYRLQSHHDFLDQLVYTPLIFERHNEPDNLLERQAITEDAYTISALLLQSAVKEHDHPDATDAEKAKLRGTIQEFTAITLLNHAKDPDHLTLPAPTVSDLAHKTDIIHHTVTDGSYRTVNIQMKSGYEAATDIRNMPTQGGIVVTSWQIGNNYSGGLKTTRALLRQFEGTASENDYHHLANAQADLFDLVYATDETGMSVAA